jgi:hypothetical protein
VSKCNLSQTHMTFDRLHDCHISLRSKSGRNLAVLNFFLHGEGPRSRCYGRTAALRFLVQPCDEDEQFFLPSFTSNGAPVE